jgi:hypothetical protein
LEHLDGQRLIAEFARAAPVLQRLEQRLAAALLCRRKAQHLGRGFQAKIHVTHAH